MSNIDANTNAGDGVIRRPIRHLSRRHAGGLLATGLIGAALAVSGLPLAQAQGQGAAPAADGWPAHPIRVIVPYAAGQGADVLMRIVAADLAKTLNQSIVIDNRAGAGGNIGTGAAAKSTADGYTFALGTNATHAANAFLYSAPGYDDARDFVPVAMIGLLPMVISTSLADLPGNGIAELIARAKAKPDSLEVGLPSTTASVVLARFVADAQAPLFGVKYKSSSQAMTDTIGGQIPLVIDTVTATRPQLAGGKLRALGITSAKSSALLPGVKSVAEQGVAGFEVVAWDALFAPSGTPLAIVDRMAAAVRHALEQPEVRQKLLDNGVEPLFMDRPTLARFTEAERPKWGAAIRSAGLRID